jgi:glutathione S-transferase
VLQWLFFEQHAVVPSIGAAYFWLCLVKGGRELQQHTLDDWMEEGQRALGMLDRHIATSRFFAGDRYSIADIALYAYTHLAEQCEYDLRRFPALRDWLHRVAAEPRHVAMNHVAMNHAAAHSGATDHESAAARRRLKAAAGL